LRRVKNKKYLKGGWSFMNIRDVLERYKRGELDAQSAEKMLRLDFLESINDHTVFDHAREARRGIPEVVYGETKSPQVVAEIVSRVMADRDILLISRASRDHLEAVKGVVDPQWVSFVESARIVLVEKRRPERRRGRIGIIAAGSSDIGVAEEAKVVAEAMGCEVMTAYDVGVAALHRVLEPVKRMMQAGVDCYVVAVADRDLRSGGRGRDRRSDLGRLRPWRERGGGVDGHAAILLSGSGFGQHRQRHRGRGHGGADQPQMS
jgi:NCAIR mutase (PurE)-related protein